MSLEELQANFPLLSEENYEQTSPKDPAYNCIAWAAGKKDIWWEPFPESGYYWPDNFPLDTSVETLMRVYSLEGFVECQDGTPEEGFEKIVIYGSEWGYEHAARLLPSGKWSSKMGPDEDISHDTPDLLVGNFYGRIVCFMKRPLQAPAAGGSSVQETGEGQGIATQSSNQSAPA